MCNLKKMVDTLRDAGIEGSLWVDGSFLTKKIDPEDVDVALQVSSEFVSQATQEQQLALLRFAELRQTDYRSDAYIFFVYPEGDARNHDVSDGRAFWLKHFGASRGGQGKGLAVVSL